MLAFDDLETTLQHSIHFSFPLVTFVHLRFTETQTITAVSKHNYCSHKFHCYLGGQHRLATPPLNAAAFTIVVPLECAVVQFKFQANRPRRLPQRRQSADRISKFCMHVACISTRRHSRLHTRIVSKSSVVLSTDSSHYDYTLGRADHTKLVVETTQHVVGCRLSHFSVNFLCPTLDTAAMLVYLPCPAFLTLSDRL